MSQDDTSRTTHGITPMVCVATALLARSTIGTVYSKHTWPYCPTVKCAVRTR